MRDVLKFFVNMTHIISFCSLIAIWIIGIIDEIIGPAKFEQIMSALGISDGFRRIWIIGAIMFLLLIVTYFIKGKYFVD